MKTKEQKGGSMEDGIVDIEKVKKLLRDYFKCLCEAVIKERVDKNG